MIKLRGHHLGLIIENWRDDFKNLEVALASARRKNGERIYDEDTVRQVVSFLRELVESNKRFRIVAQQPDSLCKLCCNYDNQVPSGCRLDSKKGVGYGEDYTYLLRIGGFGNNSWMPGKNKTIRELLQYSLAVISCDS